MDKPYLRVLKDEPPANARPTESGEQLDVAWIVMGVLFLFVLILSVLRANN